MATTKKPTAKAVKEFAEAAFVQPEAETFMENEQNEIVEQPKAAKKETAKKDTWEIKDRTYYLKGNSIPITFTLNSRHNLRYPLLWFDETTKEQREIRYATNQNSPLVEEQKGQVTLGHIIFRDGVLTVPKTKQNLQKLLSLYHPALNKKYYEFNPVANAETDLDEIELEVEALNMALEMDIDHAESILRVEVGSRVNKMSSKEIRRDLLLMARKNPNLFLDLANDENVQLRNTAIVAAEHRIIVLSQDQRTFTWGDNGRKLMTVPFDENPYSAMAAFFKTDEGIQIYQSIQKRLK
jgi:hypothetical protein